MNTSRRTARQNATTSSEQPQIVDMEIDLVKAPSSAADRLRRLNARANRNAEKLRRAAEANTVRLVGKPSL